MLTLRSGLQSGADLHSLIAAKALGFSVFGLMPLGFRTLDGPRPEYAELYNAKEHSSSAYPPRTCENVRDSDATIRFAKFFDSSGEKLTLKAIKQYSKPHFDVLIKDVDNFSVSAEETPQKAAEWILNNNVQTLNCAGNSEQTCKGIGLWVERYVTQMLTIYKEISISGK